MSYGLSHTSLFLKNGLRGMIKLNISSKMICIKLKACKACKAHIHSHHPIMLGIRHIYISHHICFMPYTIVCFKPMIVIFHVILEFFPYKPCVKKETTYVYNQSLCTTCTTCTNMTFFTFIMTFFDLHDVQVKAIPILNFNKDSTPKKEYLIW